MKVKFEGELGTISYIRIPRIGKRRLEIEIDDDRIAIPFRRHMKSLITLFEGWAESDVFGSLMFRHEIAPYPILLYKDDGSCWVSVGCKRFSVGDVMHIKRILKL